MKKFTPYFLLLILVWLMPTQQMQAQEEDIFECELAIELTPIGVCGNEKGEIQVNILNGLGDYTVGWTSFTNGLDREMQVSNNSFTISNLPVGPYAFRVVDNFSKCSAVKATRVVFDILRGTVTAKGNPTKCNGNGSITVNIDGNTPPYRMNVSGPVSSAMIARSNKVRIFNLPAGDYEIEVEKDGCTQTVQATVSAGEGLPDLSLTAAKDECGVNTGTVTAAINGGVGPYTLSWEGPTSGSSAVSRSVDVSGLETGNYQFELEDAEGCRSIAILDLNTTSLNIAVDSKPEINGKNGFLKVHIEGGVPAYTIAWSGTESGEQVANSLAESISLPAGDYTVTVTDAAGCSIWDSGTIEVVTYTPKATPDAGQSTGRNGQSTGKLLVENTPLLHQNYPNPFDTQTIIRFELPESMDVQLTIQDHFGRIVSTTKKGYRKGLNQFTLNRADLSAGMYFYTISTDKFQATKRMVIR